MMNVVSRGSHQLVSRTFCFICNERMNEVSKLKSCPVSLIYS